MRYGKSLDLFEAFAFLTRSRL